MNWSHVRRVLALAAILILMMITAGVGAAASDSTADMILYGGKIATVDDNFSVAQAVAIDEEESSPSEPTKTSCSSPDLARAR